MTMTREALAIIYPYFRISGYVYLHLPHRLTNQCKIVPGVRFIAFVKDGKIVIEQEVKNNE